MVVARGWHRPVTLRALLGVGAALLLCWLLLLAAGVWWGYAHWQTHMALRDQPLTLRLPAGTPAELAVQRPVALTIEAAPRVRLPVRQTVQAQLTEPFVANATVRGEVPVDTVIQLTHVVPVRTTLQASVPVVRWLPAFDLTLPITVEVPLTLALPVRTVVQLDLALQVSGRLPSTVALPVDHVFQLRPKVHAEVSTTLTERSVVRLTQDTSAMPMRIERADLRVPFDLTWVQTRQRR